MIRVKADLPRWVQELQDEIRRIREQEAVDKRKVEVILSERKAAL